MLKKTSRRCGCPDHIPVCVLGHVGGRFEKYLERNGYPGATIARFLPAACHFAHWLNTQGVPVQEADRKFAAQFLEHLREHGYSQQDPLRVVKHLLAVTTGKEAAAPTCEPGSIQFELDQFSTHLTSTCGLATTTSKTWLSYVKQFLVKCFENGKVEISEITPVVIHDFVIGFAEHWKPGSVGVIRSSLKSYLRFRKLRGDSVEPLISALPLIANWKRNKVRAIPSKEQLRVFLRGFDQSKPTGLRDYAIARCLVDLGLRAHEVAGLTLDSIDWRLGAITIQSTKGRCTQKLPLPDTTGKAISEYLVRGRQKTTVRALFLPNQSPLNRAMTSRGIRSMVARAMQRCGFHDQFHGTHILRHTMAMRLQESGASLKEIADILGHKYLQTTTIYARPNLAALRAVALPWVRRQP